VVEVVKEVDFFFFFSVSFPLQQQKNRDQK